MIESRPAASSVLFYGRSARRDGGKGQSKDARLLPRPKLVPTTIDDRGERYTDSRDGLFVAKPLYADGLAIVGDPQGYDQWTWDARRAVLTTAVNTTDQLEQPWGFQYDAAGRQLSASQSQAYTPHQGEEIDCQMTLTRQYDAENRITGGSEAAPTSFASGRCGTLVNSVYRYIWGANGHPVRMGAVMGTNPSNVNFDSLHWDGDQLLFTTNPYGQVDDIKLGDQADVTPLDPAFTGLTFWDHVDGIQAFCHNSTGNGGLDTNDTRLLTRGQRPLGCLLSGNNQMKVPNSEIFTADYPITSAAQMVGQGAILGMLRSDGIDDGYNVIQGVRSYDPAAGTWTTPDAYAGEVHDPASQKTYLWNRNSPVAYNDPSGYTVEVNSPQIAEMLDILSQNSSIAAGIIQSLVQSSDVYKIGLALPNAFVRQNGFIRGYRGTHGIRLIPFYNDFKTPLTLGDAIALLAHELGHAKHNVEGTLDRLRMAAAPAGNAYGAQNMDEYDASEIRLKILGQLKTSGLGLSTLTQPLGVGTPLDQWINYSADLRSSIGVGSTTWNPERLSDIIGGLGN